MDENQILDRKIFNSLGHYKKHHQSRIDTSVPNSRGLLFTRPGAHGYFSYSEIRNCSPFDRFEVYTESKSIGVMTLNDIKMKFGL